MTPDIEGLGRVGGAALDVLVYLLVYQHSFICQIFIKTQCYDIYLNSAIARVCFDLMSCGKTALGSSGRKHGGQTAGHTGSRR